MEGGDHGSGERPAVPRAYRALLRLLPRDFRRDFGDDIGTLFARRLGSARGAARAQVWARGISDVVGAALAERLRVRTKSRPLRPAGARRVLDGAVLDVRFAFRGLGRAPGFAAAAVATLGLGLGVLTGLFTVLDAVVLRPLPYPDAERLAVVHSPFLTVENAGEWQRAQTVAEATAAFTVAGATAQTPNGAVPVSVLPAGRGLTDLVGIRAVQGRAFVAGDHAPGAADVALVTRSFARTWFGDASVVGRGLELDGRVYEVVGTVDADVLLRYRDLDVWVPLENADVRSNALLAKLRPGVTPDAAMAALAPLAARMATREQRARLAHLQVADVRVLAARDAVLLGIDGTVWTLFGAGVLVLLLAGVNVAALLVGRTVDRADELSVRVALGAGRARLVRQLVVEAAVLAALGCAAGLGLASAAPALLALAPDLVPRADEVGLNVRAVGFGVAAATLCVLLCGVLPGVAAARTATAVRNSRGRSRARGATRAQATLAVVQIGAAVVLVVGCVLMMRTWATLRPVDPGFAVEGRAVIALTLPGDPYPDDDARRAFAHRVLARFRSVTGTAAVALTTDLPLTGNTMVLPVDAVDGVAPDEPRNVHVRAVSADYHAFMEMPLVAGRGIESDDAAGGRPVAVVNEHAAAALWGAGRDPIGRGVRLSRGLDTAIEATVVGVVRDSWNFGPRPSPEIFVPFDQFPFARFHVVLMTGPDEQPLDAAALRAALADVDSRLPAREITMLADMIGWSIALPRFLALLLALLGSVAIVLAAMGCFAVLSRAVAGRTRELGIRMALGARGADIVALVVRRAGAMAAAGIAIGVALSFVSTRVLAAYLHGVTPTDPVSFATAALVLAAAVAAAALRPALLAMRTDPAATMRD